MGNTRFDFHAASELILAVNKARITLEEQNENVMKDFEMLRNDFKDDGYDKYAVDMLEASRCVKEITGKLDKLKDSLEEYAKELSEV